MEPHQPLQPLQLVLQSLFSLLLVFLTGFFVAVELALATARPTRIEVLAGQNVFGAKKAHEALRHLHGYLHATKFGVLGTALILGKVADPIIEHFLGPLAKSIHPIIIEWTPILIVAIVEFILGELVPTTLAVERGEKILLVCIHPLDIFYKIFKAPIHVMGKIASLLLRPFGVGQGHEDTAHSEAELRQIVAASRAGGAIEEAEAHLVGRVFDFTEREAKDVLVPRPDVVFLSTIKTLQDNLAIVEKAGHTRYPLMEAQSPDDILGMIHAKDLLALTHQESHEEDNVRLRRIVRKMPRIPETKRIEELLRDLQRTRQHMAIVIDEYGGTAGIVTLEDIIEEIVGDIHDEFEKVSPEMVSSDQLGQESYLVDAGMSLDKLRSQLNLVGPTEELEVDTIGGWILNQHEGIPRIGDNIAFGDATFTITEMSGRRVRRVRINPPVRFHEEITTT
jgi:CBS domain containing-hemolysin-like protein